MCSRAHERLTRRLRGPPRHEGIQLEGLYTHERSYPPSCGLRGSIVYSPNTPGRKSWTAPHIEKWDMGSLLTHPIYPPTF